MLYEVAMIKRPTKKEIEDEGKSEELVLPPVCVIANDPQGAAVQAVIKHKDSVPADMSKIDVLVRPFVSSK